MRGAAEKFSRAFLLEKSVYILSLFCLFPYIKVSAMANTIVNER